MITKNTFKCCFCKRKAEGYGNNPAPLKARGKCCDACNINVIASRIMRGVRDGY